MTRMLILVSLTFVLRALVLSEERPVFRIEEALNLEHYTVEARGALAHALQCARDSGSTAITTEDVLIGLAEPDVYAARFLGRAGLGVKELKLRLGKESAVVDSKPSPVGRPFDENAKTVLRFALREATEARRTKVSSVDILLGIIGDGESPAARILIDGDVSAVEIRTVVRVDQDSGQFPLE